MQTEAAVVDDDDNDDESYGGDEDESESSAGDACDTSSERGKYQNVLPYVHGYSVTSCVL